MNRERTLQAWPTTFAPPPEDRTPIPVLIQIPRVAVNSRPSSRFAEPARVKPRRRLRRQVRWACYGMLAVLPPALSAVAYREGRQAALLEIHAPRAAETVAEPLPPRVSLSIEPALPPPPAEPAAPVVFPGYLLPEDSLEEPADARD